MTFEKVPEREQCTQDTPSGSRDRRVFREAVAEVALQVKQAFPACHNRLDNARPGLYCRARDARGLTLVLRTAHDSSVDSAAVLGLAARKPPTDFYRCVLVGWEPGRRVPSSGLSGGKRVARIKLENLVKTFGAQVTAVAGINLDMRDGEFMIFVGPSGCGKTTTLNMISGLEQPTSGRVIIGDRVVNDVEPGERGLGMVFQNLALFPHLTVFDNIAFGLRVQKLPIADIRQRVQQAAETFRITHLLPKKPSQCSGGEAQRVALARTTITNPDVLLLDEPLSSLDAKLRIDMRTELKRLHELLRSTFVYVTHDQAEAMTMADRITVMRAGHIQQLGTPLEIYRRPANLFVASFFGTPTMNIITGQIQGHGRQRFRAQHLDLDLDDTAVPEAAIGCEVQLGVRAEHVCLGNHGTPAEVQLTEPLGDETLVFFDYGGDTQLVAKVSGDCAFNIGDRIHFRCNPAGMLFFDAQDGSRLTP
jgi:multiple sugar transport system ATP-binding protein